MALQDSTPGTVAPLGAVPRAFVAIGAKVNEIIASLNLLKRVRNLQAVAPLKITSAAENSIISIDETAFQKYVQQIPAPALGGASGGGGGGDTTGGGGGTVVTELHNTSGPASIDIDGNGIVLNGTNDIEIDTDGILVYGAGDYFAIHTSNGFNVTGSGQAETTIDSDGILLQGANGLSSSYKVRTTASSVSFSDTSTNGIEISARRMLATNGSYSTSYHQTGMRSTYGGAYGELSHLGLNVISSTTASVTAGGFRYQGGSSQSIEASSTGFFVTNGSSSISVTYGAVTRNITLKEIDVCDSGTPKKMLVLGSAPY